MSAKGDDVVAALAQVDLSEYLSTSSDDSACEALASSLREYGAAIVVDSRVSHSDAAAFRSLMERYFAQPTEDKLADARPEVFYQVGSTPDHVERPRENSDFVAGLEPGNEPVSASAVADRRKDPKWRFFWRIGDRPKPDETKFAALNAPQVVPSAFAGEWERTMDAFGNRMLATVKTASEMLAIGLGLPSDVLTRKLLLGPHLLAPTGADLRMQELREEGAPLAGYHYDLNYITIHAAASFPGLYIWTRDGRRLRVRVPPGCLLLQAGVQLEHLTGGVIKRGFHEVVVSKATLEAAEKAISDGRSLWRCVAFIGRGVFLGNQAL